MKTLTIYNLLFIQDNGKEFQNITSNFISIRKKITESAQQLLIQ